MDSRGRYGNLGPMSNYTMRFLLGSLLLWNSFDMSFQRKGETAK
jgi:hypothetical protein